MNDYPRRPTGCWSCDDQSVEWPTFLQAVREFHRALHCLVRALLTPAVRALMPLAERMAS